MSDLEMASGDKRRLITDSSQRYATDNPRRLHDGAYRDVLSWVRGEANRHGNPVRIAAWWRGGWYWVDTAYPDGYAE